jgi:hypothetical protein
MELVAAQNVFALRLYEWSQHDFLRELEAGCPLLSLITQNNRRIGALVFWNQSLSSAERQRLANALTMLSHDHARHLKGEVTSEEVNYWKEQVYKQTTMHMDDLPPLETSDTSLPTFRPVDIDGCLDILAGSLSPVLGKVSKRRSGVRCLRMIGDWKIITEFTYERWHKNLTCVHQFIRKDDRSKIPTPEIGPKPFPRSLLLFWGVYNRTVVAVESQADSEPMAKAMAKFAEHFVSQADPLFLGLGIH